tara:strand:- start:373 stop:675 length:303 start_codon:yes stop_codon:yes gene_type:complete
MFVGISMRPTERRWGTLKNQITVSKITNPIVIIIGTHLWTRITIGEMHFPTSIACVISVSILPTRKRKSPGPKKIQPPGDGWISVTRDAASLIFSCRIRI